MDVKKNKIIVPYHLLCMSHAMLRSTFECISPRPQRPGTNLVAYASEWSMDHPDLPIPYNIIDWKMGTRVGVWGGTCTCPNGQTYQVGDRGNMCGSLACTGGTGGTCNKGEGEWAFRKVCAHSRWDSNSVAAATSTPQIYLATGRIHLGNVR